MPPPVGIVKAGSAAVDTAKMADDLAMLTKISADTKQFRKALDATGGTLGDISDTSKLLNKVDDETFELALKNTKVTESLNGADPQKLADALNGINDSSRLADIGKKLDTEVFENIKNLDPALAKKLRPGLVGQAKNISKNFFRSKTTLKNLDDTIESISKVTKNVGNAPKNADEVTDIAKKIPVDADEAKQAEIIAKQTAGNSDDVRKSIKSVNKLLKEGSESSNSLKKALGELGITPGSVAIGAGVIVLLCMAYDTDNPFTAVDRALDDTGKVVKGFKEVADSAATAAKDVTTGGFDFISFVSNNSWISFACSILCVILLFALFMMGMLGSMGGNNKR